jgi:hypothetical protein
MLKPLLTWGSLVVVLGAVLVMGRSDYALGQTFDPQIDISLVNPEPETSSDTLLNLVIPDGNVQFRATVAYIPSEWGIVTGDKITVGTPVGKLFSQAQLGLINAACNQQLPVEFEMLNATIDRGSTVSFNDLDENNTRDFAEDKDENGLDDAVDLYPDFLDRVVNEQPIRRAAGITLVAGTPVLLQFLVYEPGTLIDEEIPNDEELGFPTVTYLQNAGDPDIVPEPGVITDFCSPLDVENTTLGISTDNADTPDVDESGQMLSMNPTDGTYSFRSLGLGQFDTDGDTYENALDTCAQEPNVGNPRVPLDGDLDGDGLDQACDPNDDAASGGTNSDEDLDGYLNRQDNCPLDANGEPQDPENPTADETNQADEDKDGLGDICDPNPDTDDGEVLATNPEFVIDVGTGGGSPGNPPSEEKCPDCWREGWSIDGSGGGGGDDDDGGNGSTDGGDDDGGSSSLIFIIIGVIIAAVVVGGGFMFLRSRGGGGGTA